MSDLPAIPALSDEDIAHIERLKAMTPEERVRSSALAKLAEIDRDADAFEIRYQDYIRSADWKVKADAAKKAAGYRCQVCFSPHNIQAHHRTYRNLGREKPGDLTVLCDCCHELFSTYGRLHR